MKRMLKIQARLATLPVCLSLLTCAASELESDLDAQPFSGPGVDEASGELKLEPGKSYLVSSTYGVPLPGANGAPVTERYGQLFGAMQAQLEHQPGLLAMRLASSDGCGSHAAARARLARWARGRTRAARWAKRRSRSTPARRWAQRSRASSRRTGGTLRSKASGMRMAARRDCKSRLRPTRRWRAARRRACALWSCRCT